MRKNTKRCAGLLAAALLMSLLFTIPAKASVDSSAAASIEMERNHPGISANSTQDVSVAGIVENAPRNEVQNQTSGEPISGGATDTTRPWVILAVWSLAGCLLLLWWHGIRKRSKP